MHISCYGANITCTGNFDAAIIYAFITLLVFVYIFFGHWYGNKKPSLVYVQYIYSEGYFYIQFYP